MAIGTILTELWSGITQQQGVKLTQAMAATISNPPAGMTNGQLAELCLKRFIKAVARGADRTASESVLTTTQNATDQEFPET